jgi:hypothetical protein
MSYDVPDQGLRYELAGMLGAPSALARIARAHPAAHVIPLAAPELALLPVTAGLAEDVIPAALRVLESGALAGGTAAAARRRAELLTGPESGFAVLRPGLAALIEAASTIGALAYVEADYVGRDGAQAAAVWRGGHLAIGPLLLGRREEFSAETAPINVALRALGVSAAGRADEFVMAGLGRHRRTVDWVSAWARVRGLDEYFHLT